MIITFELAVVFAFIFVALNCGNYYFIREIIWSVVWCDKGGKYNSLIKLKNQASLIDRIGMNYLKSHTNTHRNAFVFWAKIKRAFALMQFLLFVLYVACIIFWQPSIFIQIFVLFVVLQSFVWFMILRFQFGLNRKTKYDRFRESK